jgi:hypothetical protein
MDTHALGLAVWRYGASASAKVRPLLIQSVADAMNGQNDPDVLNKLVRGLREIGDRRSVAALEALSAAKKRQKSKVLAETIDKTIETIKRNR